ncbi:MAG: hypothetical protein AAGD25_27475 [Cyanobacteria bacterium P01_F01_bin.150]
MINSFVLSSRFPLLLLCICAGISVGACTRNAPIGESSDTLEQGDVSSVEDGAIEGETSNDDTLVSSSSSNFDPFRDAVNTALAATELNESAETTTDWREVAIQWTRAIELMKAVPKSHEKYDVAQQRASEAYPKNLAYAQGKAGEDALPEFTVDDAKMTKVDFGEGWPFVVDGELMCERISAGEYVVDLVTLHSIDRVYAVNLPAQSRAEEKDWKKIDEIWRDSPFGSGKVPINWVIWRGEDLCDNPLEASDSNDDDGDGEDDTE